MKYILILHNRAVNILLKMNVGVVMKIRDYFLYKKLYLALFNAVSDAIRALEDFDAVSCLKILKNAQQKCEEMYISENRRS